LVRPANNAITSHGNVSGRLQLTKDNGKNQGRCWESNLEFQTMGLACANTSVPVIPLFEHC
jgi:hypothetical protein